MIQLQRLEGFYWVARTGGYARAARSFPYPISQPGVHQQVKRLEADLGVVLFERTEKDRVVLTAAGRALYEFVSPFLEGLPSVVQSVRRGTQGGRLRIQAAGLVLRQLMPAWIRRLQSRRPEIEIELSEVGTAEPALLRNGEADLLVDHLPEIPPDIETRRVGTVRAFIALPSSHPLARRKHLRLGQLHEATFIAYSAERRHRDLQMKALAAHGLSPRNSLSVDTSESILAFVAAGLGFSIVPSLLPGGPRVPGVAAHRLTRPMAAFAVVAAWRRTARPNPLIDAALAATPGDA